MTRYQHGIKRLFDIFGALAGLFFLMPAACIVIVVLKITSRGPVFYCQQRIGRFGVPFQCVKFRTMVVDADKQVQGAITTAADSRITPIGKLLRTYKFDEFPQIWNVLLGRMSFVGPRPDVPGYADMLTGDDRKVLLLRPGITGPASVFFRYEEQLLSYTPDPVAFNDRVIWPMKVRINRYYWETWKFRKDIGFILITLLPLLNRVFRLLPPSPRSPDELEAIGKECIFG